MENPCINKPSKINEIGGLDKLLNSDTMNLSNGAKQMANYRGVKLNYKPKMTDDEAYEKLTPAIRKAIQDGVQPWSARWCLKYMRKNGEAKTIHALRIGDINYMRKGFIVKRGRGINVQSSFIECNVQPLRANW